MMEILCAMLPLPRKLWVGLESNIGGQIIQNMKYADYFVLMPKERTALQGMVD
jgi:hypothetical protein